MKKFKLNNGLTVVHDPRKSDTITLEISVGTGSNNETPNIAGISHFLEQYDDVQETTIFSAIF